MIRVHAMIKSKKCTVEDCSYPRFAKGYCKMHQNLREDKKPKALKKVSKKGIENKEIKKKLLDTDMVFYLEIWNARPHVCRFCNNSLGDKPRLYYFDHILEKQAYPALRHSKDNIQLLCLECHSNKTNGHVPEWFKIEKEKLKEKWLGVKSAEDL